MTNNSNSNLTKHLDAKQSKLTQLEQGLSQLQQQLNELQQQLRVENQLQKAQQSIANEFENQKKAFRKLLKDSCSCFEIEALKDFVEDLKSIQEEVESNYEELQFSDRFLNSEQAEVEDLEEEKIDTNIDSLILSFSVPNENDDVTILDVNHLSYLLSELDSEQLARIQGLLGLSTRIKLKTKIYQQISELNLTRVKLNAIVELVSSFPSNGLALIGSNE